MNIELVVNGRPSRVVAEDIVAIDGRDPVRVLAGLKGVALADEGDQQSQLTAVRQEVRLLKAAINGLMDFAEVMGHGLDDTRKHLNLDPVFPEIPGDEPEQTDASDQP